MGERESLQLSQEDLFFNLGIGVRPVLELICRGLMRVIRASSRLLRSGLERPAQEESSGPGQGHREEAFLWPQPGSGSLKRFQGGPPSGLERAGYARVRVPCACRD